MSIKNNTMDQIKIYTDGACSGNPGPAGIGVVLNFNEHSKEISEYIGQGTNNIAELKAIQKGLALIKRRDIPVCIFTDSQYCVGVLSRNWHANANRELISEIKSLISLFIDVQIKKVSGHSGLPGNERADQLAVKAVSKGRKGACI